MDSTKYVVAAAFMGLAVALMLTPAVRLVAERLGIVAQPGGRRVHTRPTALMGGLAMYGGFMVAVFVALGMDSSTHMLKFDHRALGLLVAGTLVAVVGILDDKFELPGWVQAMTILIGAFVLTLFDVKVQYVTNPFKGGHMLWLGLFSIPVTLIWVLMVTKAVDCMDGLDGLAAGICAVAAATLMLMAMESGRWMSAVMGAALMGAAVGFLRYNYPPAKIFMGTIGAQFLGFMLAGISISGAFKITTLVAVAAPVLVLGVPLFDTTFVVLKRAMSGKAVHEADRSHLHHRLVERGLSHRQVIWAIYAMTMGLCAAAYLLYRYAY